MKQPNLLAALLAALLAVACGPATPKAQPAATAETLREVTIDDYTDNSGTFELTADQTVAAFDAIRWEDGSFITIAVNDTCVLQAYCEEPARLLAEVTNDSDPMVFHQKYVSAGEFRQMIRDVFGLAEANGAFLDGFSPVDIMAETLDEVLERANGE